MESLGIIPTVLTAMGVVAAVLLGVWGIVARYDSRLRDRMDGQVEAANERIDVHGKETSEQLGQLRDRIDAQGRETTEQLGQLRDRIDAQGRETNERIDVHGKETSEQLGQLRDRIDAQGRETTEQLGQLRERMARLEGLLEGLREAITGKRAA